MRDLHEKEFWEYYRRDIEKRRETYFQEAISLIPSDVESILDVGCGEGTFLTMLNNHFTVGLDISRTALKYVRTQKLWGNIITLPFKKESFDLVTCLEVLEHLRTGYFHQSISEIKRVAKKYIIISVPNEEPLEYFLVICPVCSCHFNSAGHVRSFNLDSLKNLFFPEFSLKTIREVGEVKYPTYNRALFSALRSYIKPKPPKGAICPQCGYKTEIEEDRISYSEMPLPLQLKVIKKFADLIWRPKRRRQYLVALYERKTG